MYTHIHTHTHTHIYIYIYILTKYIYMYIREINTWNWIDSAQDWDYWRALVNATLNFRVA